jgi:hypothetical protein
MDAIERRSYVRGDLLFKVEYKIMTSEQFEALNSLDKAILPPSNKTGGADIADRGADRGADPGFTADASLIRYLTQMDDKLNQILELLGKEKSVPPPFCHGLGQNISGSGMQIVVDQPAEVGQIIHSKFFLSKLPLAFMDIFGEIIRVTPVEENGRTAYQIGIEFIDLNITDQEKIIASVFQMQRKAIRERKTEKA